MSLKRRLAEFGFESNDDFEFVLRCLFEAQESSLRLLNPVGHSGRRKTAFAHALAHALDYPHVLYHDFSQPEPISAPINSVESSESAPDTPTEAALSVFDRRIVEACAFSEAARVILILDQLQAAAFADQIRLAQFVSSADWLDGRAHAHRRNLLLVVISEQPLYHSLARLALRVWTDRSSAAFDYKPADFRWPNIADGLFAALGTLFAQMNRSPTFSETQRLLVDLTERVRTVEQLRLVLFARVEGLERDVLYAPALEQPLALVIDQLTELLGIDEIVMEQSDDEI